MYVRCIDISVVQRGRDNTKDALLQTSSKSAIPRDSRTSLVLFPGSPSYYSGFDLAILISWSWRLNRIGSDYDDFKCMLCWRLAERVKT